MLAGRELIQSAAGDRILDRINVHVAPGEVVGIHGANGSGKTTLLRVLSGLDSPEDGAVLLDGVPLTRHPNRHKLVFSIQQTPRVFPEHTVRENCVLSSWGLDRGNGNHSHYELPPYLMNGTKAGQLSVGERRRLVLSWLWERLGRTKYFLLDEPGAGGDAKYLTDLREFIIKARELGSGVILVEHNASVLSSVVNRSLRLERGSVFESSVWPSVGQELVKLSEAAPERSTDRSIRAEAVTVARHGAVVLREVSASVGEGEVVGLLGANGCGKSTLLLALHGDPSCQILDGTIRVGAEILSKISPSSQIRRGIHLLPQEETVFRSLTVLELLRTSRDVASGTPFKLNEFIERTPRLKAISQKRGGILSRGERRLAGLARLVVLKPRFALMDEPTAGLDNVGIQFLENAVRDLSQLGCGFLIAEQNLEFVNRVCNRTIWMHKR